LARAGYRQGTQFILQIPVEKRPSFCFFFNAFLKAHKKRHLKEFAVGNGPVLCRGGHGVGKAEQHVTK
jgi:hypothetical protein